VIHAFYLPNLRVQMDAIPGRLTSVWFEAGETGAFEIVCSQYCGVSHYKMAGVLRVREPEDFDAWLQQASDYAVKMERAEAELEAGREPTLFPSFGTEPDIAPRDWGWPWEDLL
jgi:heme/copper-type cytochrome/quinol oxidase subunit 2